MINIRDIQHFLYCPHRWGLITIGNVWAENYYVVKANLEHKRVHSSGKFTKHGIEQLMSVPVWNDEYSLYGVVDCIEKQDAHLSIVEHKPTKPQNKEFNYEDAMQVFAQKVCIDVIFKTNCNAYVYYADVRRRIKLPFEDEFEKYDNNLKETIKEMRAYFESGTIPPIKKKQKCSGCSLKDLCMPRLKTSGGTYEAIMKNMR